MFDVPLLSAARTVDAKPNASAAAVTSTSYLLDIVASPVAVAPFFSRMSAMQPEWLSVRRLALRKDLSLQLTFALSEFPSSPLSSQRGVAIGTAACSGLHPPMSGDRHARHDS
jgi:hypothetical protein